MTTIKPNTLLRVLAAVLRDYQDRIDRIGAETFRLRGESFDAWEGKRRRVRLCSDLLGTVIGASDERHFEAILRELARAPAVPLERRSIIEEAARALARRRLGSAVGDDHADP